MCVGWLGFKVRYTKLELKLKESLPNIKVVVNAEKPRKGCFEVRDSTSGAKYISLLVRIKWREHAHISKSRVDA